MKKILLSCILVGLLCSSCEPESDHLERTDVERQQRIFTMNQPPPQFDWSLERHLLTKLYEARNKSVGTYTYVRNQFTGKVMAWCPSIGFPMSAATQLTNPKKRSDGHTVVLPQAEPNGLYSPSSSRGTWVMCARKDGKIVPRYYEQDVETYLIPMQEKDGMLIEMENTESSLTIDPRRP